MMAGFTPESRALIMDWERGYKKKAGWSVDDFSQAKMLDKVPITVRLEEKIVHGVRVYLQARAYENNQHYDRRNTPQIPLATVQALVFEVYSAWRSNTDDGLQLYRTDQTKRHGTKDASWVLVSTSS
jgi:hypothetical protein